MCNHKLHYKTYFNGDGELDTPLTLYSALEVQFFRGCISRYKRRELTLLMLINVLPKEKLCNFIIAQINKQIAKLAIAAC